MLWMVNFNYTRKTLRVPMIGQTNFEPIGTYFQAFDLRKFTWVNVFKMCTPFHAFQNQSPKYIINCEICRVGEREVSLVVFSKEINK